MITVTEGASIAQDPFSGCPSILGLRDLRRTLKKTLPTPLPTRRIAGLLALDPLALARGLRVANAPLHRACGTVGTVRQCVKILGGPACEALLQCRVQDQAGSQRLRILWAHALATAQATAALASASGALPPEEAYAAGLLHDLGLWVSCLREKIDGRSPRTSGAALLKAWGLPPRLVESVAWVEGERTGPVPGPLAEHLLGAEHLAEMAGFFHPDMAPGERALIEKVRFGAAGPLPRLRDSVAEALQGVGLELEAVLSPPAFLLPSPEDRVSIGGEIAAPMLGKGCATLLEFSRGESLGATLKALTTAARIYLDLDRAWFFRWEGPGNPACFRQADDQTTGSFHRHTVDLTRGEMALLGELAQEAGTVRLLRPRKDGCALLDLIGSDSALLAPVMALGSLHGFLLADRGLRGDPVGADRLQDLRALCGMAALIKENLLVQRMALRQGHAAHIDALTGVNNRRAGLVRLGKAMEESLHTGRLSTVIMLDLDHFKHINDTWGHQAGDQVLRMVARALRARFDDIGTVNRIGGEEFLVILPGRHPEEVLPLVEEVRRTIADTVVPCGEARLQVTVSLGVTATGPARESMDQLIERVDRACYASKARGRNRFSVDLDPAPA